MDYILYKNIDGKYLTLEDCIKENAVETPEDQEVLTEENKEEVLEEAKEEAKKEPEKTNIYYVTDEVHEVSISICSRTKMGCGYFET